MSVLDAQEGILEQSLHSVPSVQGTREVKANVQELPSLGGGVTSNKQIVSKVRLVHISHERQ